MNLKEVEFFDACRENDVAAARKYLAEGINLNLQDVARRRPLMEVGGAEAGKLLIEAGRISPLG